MYSTMCVPRGASKNHLAENDRRWRSAPELWSCYIGNWDRELWQQVVRTATLCWEYAAKKKKKKKKKICVEWAVDILVLVWRKSIHCWVSTKICAQNDFHIFIPGDLDLWPLELKVATLVSIIQRYATTKSYVSFLLRENPRNVSDRETDRQTDGLQHLLNSASWEGYIINKPHYPSP